MSNFTVYRGKCSPEQLRNVLLMAMTIKDIKEIEEAMRMAKFKDPRPLPDHVFLPANWYRGNNHVNRVEFCSYERLKAIRHGGATVSPRMELFDVSRRAENVLGVSFWELAKIRKKSKSGNIFEATQNLEILEGVERGNGPSLGVIFNICLREQVCVTEWGLKLHSHWLDFLRAAKVELKESQE